jgi:hypothetical protein
MQYLFLKVCIYIYSKSASRSIRQMQVFKQSISEIFVLHGVKISALLLINSVIMSSHYSKINYNYIYGFSMVTSYIFTCHRRN